MTLNQATLLYLAVDDPRLCAALAHLRDQRPTNPQSAHSRHSPLSLP
jgi:hypothetical protein